MAFNNSENSNERKKQIEILEKNLKSFQEKLLQVDRRNRSVQFKKIFAKHNFDLVVLEEYNPSICQKISEKSLKIKQSSLNILLDSVDNDEAISMRSKLRQLSNNLKQIEDETGQQTGFVGFPFIQGHANTDFFIRGPLILFPVNIEQKRQARAGGWYLNFIESRPIINGALIAAIKKKAELKIPEDIEEKFDLLIDELIDYEKSDIEDYFFKKVIEWTNDVIPLDNSKNDFRLQKIPSLTRKDIEVLGNQKFHLLNYKILGNFPQADNEIYKDYGKLLENTSSLDFGALTELIDIYDPDKLNDVDEIFDEIELDSVSDDLLNTVLDSDSSQDQVILESKRNSLVVVRGPPGTGKSQVITNLISDALTNNKKILVVCQKRAALDVVYQRLGKVGLEKFVVVLDKEHEDRVKMYQQLYDTIEDPGHYSESYMSIDSISSQINKRVNFLSNLGKALHKSYFGGVNVHKLYTLSQSNYDPKLNLSSIGLPIEWNELNDFIQKINGVEHLFKKFELDTNPWEGRIDFSVFGLREKSEIIDLLDSIKNILSDSIIAKSDVEQTELVGLFDTFLNNPGFLKRNRKASSKKISNILSVFDVNENYIHNNLPLVSKGVEFWKKLPELLKLFNGNEQRKIIESCTQKEKFVSRLELMKQQLADYDSMQEYDKKLQEFDSSIKKLLHACKEKFKVDENWSEKIRQEIHSYWIDIIEHENPVLKGNPIEEYDRNQKSLAELIESKKSLVINQIRSKIASSVNISDISGRAKTPEKQIWKEFSSELKKKRRTKPVRKLFEMYSQNFLKLAPCWLASPESVSKVFPLKRNLFDLIIVDEASQLAVERALPFLYRGKNVVIAGDEKQLQPFDLFQLKEEDDDDFDEEVAEEKSLLDLAIVQKPAIQLAWHYRSKYQDLINFSNHAFYDGLLQVAPNVRTDPKHPPIKWISCNGVWDKRKNHVEASNVIEEINSIWKNSIKSNNFPSIGVITFNDEQRDLIQEQFDKKLDNDLEFQQLHALATEGKKLDDRPFFKNIENVQGDERDIIIFSIGYAKDPDGLFVNRFGTLSQQGGQNRLNVAITRARAQMIVVCSIDPGMIKETSKNVGPRRLRQFLEYARASSQLNKEAVDEVLSRLDEKMTVSAKHNLEFDSVFETQVYQELTNRGFNVHTQIGASDYKIDLAIIHPDDPYRYILAIECDGATFHSSKSAKERDVLRQKFLENKGWKFERIWSRNWWRDPNKEISRIISRIETELKSQKNNSAEIIEEKNNDLIQKDSSEMKFDSDDSLETNNEKINYYVHDSMILIKNKTFGIKQSEIKDIFKLTESELSKVVSILMKKDDVVYEDRLRDGVLINRLFKIKKIDDSENKQVTEINTSEIDDYLNSKNLTPKTIQSQKSILLNFTSLLSKYPNESIEQVFNKFIEGKSKSSITLSKSVIYNFLKFKNGETDNISLQNDQISKKNASDELSKLPEKLANNEITPAEYRKRRDELESILFDS